jgi:hypothetical protein
VQAASIRSAFTQHGSSNQSEAAVGSQGNSAAPVGGSGSQHQVSTDSCHTHEHTELQGGVVTWGDKNIKASAGECCQACKDMADKGCNVWVWCASKDGCGGSPGQWRADIAKQQALSACSPGLHICPHFITAT